MTGSSLTEISLLSLQSAGAEPLSLPPPADPNTCVLLFTTPTGRLGRLEATESEFGVSFFRVAHGEAAAAVALAMTQYTVLGSSRAVVGAVGRGASAAPAAGFGLGAAPVDKKAPLPFTLAPFPPVC